MDLTALKLFSEEKHKPFYFAGEDPAVLMIHGFPGTPAELRPLASSLAEMGLAADGFLLPGFGPEFYAIFKRTYAERVDAVVREYGALRAKHKRVVILGYSMGGAVALNAAGQLPDLDGLILLAPLWQIGGWWQAIIWKTVRGFFPKFQPLRRVNFSDPRVREGLGSFLPGLDLDDPSLQKALREISVPRSAIDEIGELGIAGKQFASEIHCPTLIIQGSRDPVITPKRTRILHAEFGENSQYYEVDAEHDLLQPKNPSWSEIKELISTFLTDRVAS